jgi:hypothetical protein
MRRLILVLAGAALLVAPGCRRQRSRATTVEEQSGVLASVVFAADPRTAMQLSKGFHDVEQNAWRWTTSQFNVVLRPPPGAAQKGATLEVKLSVPDPVIQHVKGTTLSAKVGGLALEPQAYTAAGDNVYKREIPASALTGDAVTIEFALDKFLAAGQVEGRELGIIVSSVGLLAK